MKKSARIMFCGMVFTITVQVALIYRLHKHRPKHRHRGENQAETRVMPACKNGFVFELKEVSVRSELCLIVTFVHKLSSGVFVIIVLEKMTPVLISLK